MNAIGLSNRFIGIIYVLTPYTDTITMPTRMGLMQVKCFNSARSRTWKSVAFQSTRAVSQVTCVVPQPNSSP